MSYANCSAVAADSCSNDDCLHDYQMPTKHMRSSVAASRTLRPVYPDTLHAQRQLSAERRAGRHSL
jgi:hypothetical protein